MSLDGLDVERALSGLKDFQRRTVDYAFGRMWADEDPAPRFLVADEVGLGKTLVARGIIARTLAHLRTNRDMRIDVVYVCSNAAIAQQNVNRLNVLGDQQFAVATRLTLLPLQLAELSENRVNFVSFTPGTTFNLRSTGGIWQERVVLHRMLAMERPDLRAPLLHLFRCGVALPRFRNQVRNSVEPINPALAKSFLTKISRQRGLWRRIEELCDLFARARTNIPHEQRQLQYGLVGELRQMLARVCVDALEPDLVIMDEFQRFQDLLDGDDDAAELAKAVTDYVTPEGHQVRVLLLSATPYKPLTLSEDDEDHYQGFLRTLGFLFNDPGKLAGLEDDLRAFRRSLYQHDPAGGRRARDRVEQLLRSVMSRTERVGRTVGRDAMMATRIQRATVTPRDLRQARFEHEVTAALDAQDPLEYWKSAPYVLHFMKDYQVKKKLQEASRNPPRSLRRALRGHKDALLTERQVERYRALDLGNGRLRSLVDDMVEPGQWRLLWVHPSVPYLVPGGAYAEVPAFTKALVFSAWTVVPDAISAACSYEVERRIVERSGLKASYRDLYERQRPLLRFTRSKGRLTGMPTLALLYPSVSLAEAVDPLRLALAQRGDGPVPEASVRPQVARAVEKLLRATGSWPGPRGGPPDQRWYWAAPAMLDRHHGTSVQRWVRTGGGWLTRLGGKEEDRSLPRHIEQFRDAANGSLDPELGPAPDDLVDVLVDLALGSPAVCALRSLLRLSPGIAATDPGVLGAAATIANGFRTLFNLPETILLLRSEDEDTYWHLVLRHAIEGNLQSVLDEYVHQLEESLGLADHDAPEVVEQVATAVADALSIRTAQISADELNLTEAGRLRLKRFRMRTRFALRFGDLSDDQDQTMARVGTVRTAFNSPFRPFVLASTSVGQEGLDFHPYCHCVYHWNLPSNPVDLEQREGRVHRYKGHAVRRNVARRWGLGALRDHMDGQGDPWRVLFRVAADAREVDANDLVPYWIYEVEGGVKVERRIPMFPLSREVAKLARLQRGLAVYRLAFGQPRQEDLLEFLTRGGGPGDVERLEISLEPGGA